MDSFNIILALILVCVCVVSAPKDPDETVTTTTEATTAPYDPYLIVNETDGTTTEATTAPEDPYPIVIETDATTTAATTIPEVPPPEDVPDVVATDQTTETTTTADTTTATDTTTVAETTTTVTHVETTTVPEDPPLDDVPDVVATDQTTETTTTADTTTATDTTTVAETTTTETQVETTTVVDGNWGDWSAWSSCSSFCGTGNQYRSRACDNPEPSAGGNDCEGSSTESASCSTGTECCAPKVFDVVFLIDKTFRTSWFSSSNYQGEMKDFFKNVTHIFEITPSRTRISAATMGSEVSLLFDFTTHTSAGDIESEIDGISRSYGTVNSKDALDFVRGTMLTTENGARSDVSDVLIMVVSDVNTEESDISAQKLKDNGVYMMIVEEDPYSSSLLQPVADVYKSFSTAPGIKDALIDIHQGFPCNYFCATSFFALDSPSSLSSGNDTSAGYLYLMTDSPFQATCCGATLAWEFFAVNYGTVEIMVFRQVSTNGYNLVGSTQIIIPEEYANTTVSFSLTSTERIAFVKGDVIGWYTSGSNVIGHASCTTTSRSDCPQYNKRLSMPGATFTAGETIDFSSAETLQNMGYSIKMSTTNNTELTLIPIQNETEIEENTPIGYKVMYFRATDTDLNDNITLELSGDHSLFSLGELKNEQVTLNLMSKVPTGGSSYIITVTGTDSCQHTASVTVTVSTYNAPPIINNLPYIHEISESTKSAIHLYTINVTDATEDPICCTLSQTLPNTLNFNLTEENGVYSIWTVPEPAFSYNDIDAYRVFICCEDPYGSSNSYLVLRLIEDKNEEKYTPPDWFFTALIISMFPISIMTIITCATVVLTMFFLDGETVEERTSQNEEITETVEQEDRISCITPDPEDNMDSRDILESVNKDKVETVNETEVKTENDTINFKNLYNDEVVKIPVWRGRWKKAVQEGNVRNTWHDITHKLKRTDVGTITDARTGGDAFGVELKLFNYGGKPVEVKSEEEKAIKILQRKNEIKDKWKEMIAKSQQKKNEQQRPRNLVSKLSRDVLDRDTLNVSRVSTQNTSTGDNVSNKLEDADTKEMKTPTIKSNLEILSDDEAKMFTREPSMQSASITGESSTDNVELDGEVHTENDSTVLEVSVGRENTKFDNSDILSIFNEVTTSGTAGTRTTMKFKDKKSPK